MSSIEFSLSLLLQDLNSNSEWKSMVVIIIEPVNQFACKILSSFHYYDYFTLLDYRSRREIQSKWKGWVMNIEILSKVSSWVHSRAWAWIWIWASPIQHSNWCRWSNEKCAIDVPLVLASFIFKSIFTLLIDIAFIYIYINIVYFGPVANNTVNNSYNNDDNDKRHNSKLAMNNNHRNNTAKG